ncbi:hypothetical protein [Nesterenkonia sp. HG001]|uniref:hypothetical protein n=1 Tax=Nesterenkonia sp. HG001 TaxID=2983207 RepID=UPI002AC771FD|nr:hypothetical protein [Nesterenkonia sp. HG001]MDZ5077532.1 hypothetical protein [Nesterenkonia sp. HG001]
MSLEIKEQRMQAGTSRIDDRAPTADAREVMPGSRSSYARIPAAFRLQFIVPTLIWVPLLVFMASWAIALVIGFWGDAISDDRIAAQDPIYTGASQAALWCLLFMAAYAGTHNFPFSLALSYSRRVYVIGTFLAFLAVSVAFGVAFGLVAAIEQWTDGYGIHLYNFALPYLIGDGLWAGGLLAATVSLLLMLVGFASVMLYKRFSVAVLWALILGLVAVLAVAAMLITQSQGWTTVWQWMTEQTALSWTAWLVLPIAALTGGSYWMIRRATA